MLYRIQAAVVDLLHGESLIDVDGFASDFAQLYLAHRAGVDTEVFIDAVGKIRTGSFGSRRRERKELTRHWVQRLDRRFLGPIEEQGLEVRLGRSEEQEILRLTALARRRSGSREFESLLELFRKFIESRGVDQFWVSRRRGEMRPKPESIAQGLLTAFLYPEMQRRAGFVLREVRSGIGYIDLMAVFGQARRHLVELKVLTRDRVTGLQQLGRYLATEDLPQGWLFMLDARESSGRAEIRDGTVEVAGRTIHRLVVDINPPAPSSLG